MQYTKLKERKNRGLTYWKENGKLSLFTDDW
jgi:hypothetical protein